MARELAPVCTGEPDKLVPSRTGEAGRAARPSPAARMIFMLIVVIAVSSSESTLAQFSATRTNPISLDEPQLSQPVHANHTPSPSRPNAPSPPTDREEPARGPPFPLAPGWPSGGWPLAGPSTGAQINAAGPADVQMKQNPQLPTETSWLDRPDSGNPNQGQPEERKRRERLSTGDRGPPDGGGAKLKRLLVRQLSDLVMNGRLDELKLAVSESGKLHFRTNSGPAGSRLTTSGNSPEIRPDSIQFDGAAHSRESAANPMNPRAPGNSNGVFYGDHWRPNYSLPLEFDTDNFAEREPAPSPIRLMMTNSTGNSDRNWLRNNSKQSGANGELDGSLGALLINDLGGQNESERADSRPLHQNQGDYRDKQNGISSVKNYGLGAISQVPPAAFEPSFLMKDESMDGPGESLEFVPDVASLPGDHATEQQPLSSSSSPAGLATTNNVNEGLSIYVDYTYDDSEVIVCDNVDNNIFRREQVIEMSDQQLANLTFKGSRRELMYCVERRTRLMKVITTVITPILFTIIILVGLIGNFAVIFVILEDRKQGIELSPPNLLILDLSVADLSFIIFCIPFTGWDYAVGHWIFGDTWCKLNQYLIVVCALSSIYTLVLMSVDRFMAVVYPIQCLRVRTSRNTLYAITFKWIIILLISIPAARMHGNVSIYDDTQWQCRFLMAEYNAVAFQIIFFLTSYLLPLLLIAVLYMGLLNKLWYGNKPVGHRESTKMVESKRKVTWLVAGIVVVFAICWCPIQVMLIMMRLQMHEITITYVAIQVFAHILGYMNSCVNPIVYAFASENFNNSFKRSKLGRLFRASTPWLKHSEPPNESHSRAGGSHITRTARNNSHSHICSEQQQAPSRSHSQSQSHALNQQSTHSNYETSEHELHDCNSMPNSQGRRHLEKAAAQMTTSTLDCSGSLQTNHNAKNHIETSPSSGDTQTSTMSDCFRLSQLNSDGRDESCENYRPQEKMRHQLSGSLSDSGCNPQNPGGLTKLVVQAEVASFAQTKLEPRDRCEFKLAQQASSSSSLSNVIKKQQQQQRPSADCQSGAALGSSVISPAGSQQPKQQLVAQVSQTDSRSISHRCEPIKQQI